MTTYYKFTNGDRPTHGEGWYPTRKDGTTLSTAWLPPHRPELCYSGWHVTTAPYLPHHIGADLYVCEVRGDAEYGYNKSVHAQLRFRTKVAAWDLQAIRDFAQDAYATADAYGTYTADRRAVYAAYPATKAAAYALKASSAAIYSSYPSYSPVYDANKAPIARNAERKRQSQWIIDRCNLQETL